MRQSNKNNNSFFLILLLATMTVAAPFIYYKIYQNKIAVLAREEIAGEAPQEESGGLETLPDASGADLGSAAEESRENPPVSSEVVQAQGEFPAGQSEAHRAFEESGVQESAKESEPSHSPKEQSKEESGFRQAGASYFADALFIGDSRTVGLMEYGGIDHATFFADTGMSVKDVVSKSYAVKGKGKLRLSDLLSSGNYGKIYLMFGVNELGYPYEEFTERYRGVVDTIREAQPNALIFLQGNLHVTEKKSASSKIYTNEKLNEFNSFIASLADDEKTIYLDVNEIFDDEKGYLKGELSNDGVHVYGKYYKEWTDWLLTKAR